MAALTCSVAIQWGTTQFTRTFIRSLRGARVAVNRMRPAFAAAYSGES
jgi:hypothetical protein